MYQIFTGGLGEGSTNLRATLITALTDVASYAEAREIGGRTMFNWFAQQGLISTYVDQGVTRMRRLSSGNFGIMWAHQPELRAGRGYSQGRLLLAADGVPAEQNVVNLLSCPQNIRGIRRVQVPGEDGLPVLRDEEYVLPGIGSAQYRETNGLRSIHVHPELEEEAAAQAAERAQEVYRSLHNGTIFSTTIANSGGEIRWFNFIKASKMVSELRQLLKTSEEAKIIYGPIVYSAIVAVPPVELAIGLMDLSINIASMVLQSVWS